MIKRLTLTFILIIPGILAAGVFGHFALQDWSLLQRSYAHYSEVAASHPSMQALFAAYAQQNIHRINLFADGVWTLLSAIIAAIGVHGLCTVNTPRQERTDHEL